MLFALLLSVMLLLIGIGASEASFNQQAGPWSDPITLATEGRRPLLVADSAGDLHLFYGGESEDQDPEVAATIYYMSRIGGEWRPPLDILFSTLGAVDLDGAVIDGAGNLHVAWHDNEGVYHSRVHVSMAGNASNWETELVLPGRLPSGEMVLDDNGRLHMALATDLSAVVYLYSDDGGTRWSPPLPVYREFDTEELAIGGVQLAVDQSGAVHVTWYETAAEVDWSPWSVWYGRSSDEGNSWQVREVATPEFGMSDVAVDGDNNVHLVYGRTIGHSDGRWHQWSSDGGQTWTNARPLYPGVEHASGVTGGFDFALDSARRLHMVNSYGRQDGDVSAWHMVWLGTMWSEPEVLLDTRYHAHQPRLAIAGGNELNFVALAPRQAFSLVYRLGAADSPATERREMPTRVIETIADSGSVDEEAAAEPTPVVPRTALSDEALAMPGSGRPFDALLLSAAASAITILILVAVMRRKSRR